jgi:predicted TIM-barrel fold metal-dependent hydrolase
MRYTGPILDAHHHLWDLKLEKHPWLVPQPGRRKVFGDPTPLYRDYLPDDLERDAAGLHLVGSVHIEASWDRSDPVGETRWIAGLKQRHRLPTVAVVRAPLDDPGVGAILEAQRAFDFVRGVRFILSWHEDPEKRFVERADYMTDSRWLAGFALLREFGLSFDMLIYPGQLGDAADLADRFPDTTIIVNHAGSPVDRDAVAMDHWRRGLKELAKRPNVRLKISDLCAYDHDWTLESLRPVVLDCLDAFGLGRAMFASDFPVAGLHTGYAQMYDAFADIVQDLTAEEQRALFHDNAVRDYRIDKTDSRP